LPSYELLGFPLVCPLQLEAIGFNRDLDLLIGLISPPKSAPKELNMLAYRLVIIRLIHVVFRPKTQALCQLFLGSGKFTVVHESNDLNPKLVNVGVRPTTGFGFRSSPRLS
jgi:hypothetical protein